MHPTSAHRSADRRTSGRTSGRTSVLSSLRGRRSLVVLALALVAALVLPSVARAKPAAGDAAAVEKPIRTLINAVRYSKDAMALKMLDGATQGAELLEADWEKATPEQRATFEKLFHELFAAIAFPQIRENFEHLETILYEKPEVKGDRATIKSTLVILHPLKKQEIKVEYALKKHASGWKVVDVTVLGTGGNSMLTDIRKEQVRPLFNQGGMDHLLSLMDQRAKQLAEQARRKAASK